MKAIARFEVSDAQPREVVLSSLPMRSIRWDVRRSFQGDLVGASHAAMNLAALVDSAQDGRASAVVAHEHVSGILMGREGAFVVQHANPARVPDAGWSGRIVPGTGTGDLHGITGTVVWRLDAETAAAEDVFRPGTVEFEFELPGQPA